MKDYLVCYIHGKRRALLWDELERLKISEQELYEERLARRHAYDEWLFEHIEGDTRTFHDMEEQWGALLDREDDADLAPRGCEMNDDDKTWTVNADHDIRVASWHIADLLLGPDDGAIDRDDIECQIQEVLKKSFSETTARDPIFGPVDPENPPLGFRPAGKRKHE